MCSALSTPHVDEVGHEVLRMRMVVRGIMIGSSPAQVSELKSLIVSSTQTLSGAMRQDIDPAIAKQVNKLKTLVPKYAAQISKIEQANNKMGGQISKACAGELEILQNKLMALSDRFGTNEVSLKIIEIIALANSYRYSGSFAADATSVEKFNRRSDIVRRHCQVENRNQRVADSKRGFAGRQGNSWADFWMITCKQVDAWVKANSDFEAAMTTQEAIFSEINSQL